MFKRVENEHSNKFWRDRHGRGIEEPPGASYNSPQIAFGEVFVRASGLVVFVHLFFSDERPVTFLAPIDPRTGPTIRRGS